MKNAFLVKVFQQIDLKAGLLEDFAQSLVGVERFVIVAAGAVTAGLPI